MTKRKARAQRGFTLIELMIVVAVVGVLSLVAWPSYQNQIRKGARAEAKTALLKTASALERYYTDHNCYPSAAATCDSATTSALAFTALGVPAFSGDNATSSKYDLAVTVTAQAFTITATPRAADPDCGNLSYTNTTAKASTIGTNATCW